MDKNSQRYPGLLQTSTMESFTAIVNIWNPLTVVVKASILDVCGALGYTFGVSLTSDDDAIYIRSRGEEFCKKSVLRNFTKIHRKTSLPESLF